MFCIPSCVALPLVVSKRKPAKFVSLFHSRLPLPFGLMIKKIIELHCCNAVTEMG